MEVFSLLKLKKARGNAVTQSASSRTTTISTSALYLSSDAIHGGGGGASFDDGPFFDLEFSAGEESTPSEFKMSVSSPRHRLSSSSPFLSEEILFNGRLFRLESSSSSSFSASEPKAMPQFPASTLKSATNLRVFMFRSRSTSRTPRPERKLPKDVILQCISKIKPFYVKVSNLSFSGQSKNRFAAKQSHVKAAVPGRLRKSRSASSAVASVVSPLIVAPRRDDSLMQQEDGIQSAIAHCKRSFHADKGFGVAELPMVRSMSDPGGERCAGEDRGGGSSADDFNVC